VTDPCPPSLTPEQRSRVQGLYDAMKAEAITLGETVIAQEKALDREFAERGMTPGTLGNLTAQCPGARAASRRPFELSSHYGGVADQGPDEDLLRTARI
jgi:hypothetical protein